MQPDPRRRRSCRILSFRESGSTTPATSGAGLPTANLAFLGRVDRQVKIHGLRIEPGEIEARLVEHPGIRQTAVVVRDDAAGGRAARLVAYYAAFTGAIPSAVELRDYLREQLASYMVRAAYVRLATLPLTLRQGRLPGPAGARVGA